MPVEVRAGTQASKPPKRSESREDRTARWIPVVLFLLGLFGAVFVTIGIKLWS